jgi:hypothetical protein
MEGSQAGLEMLSNGDGETLGPQVAAGLHLEDPPEEHSGEATQWPGENRMLEQHEQEAEVNVVCTAGMSLESWVTAGCSCRAYSKAWIVNPM